MYLLPDFGHPKVYETSVWTPRFQILAKPMPTVHSSNMLTTKSFFSYNRHLLKRKQSGYLQLAQTFSLILSVSAHVAHQKSGELTFYPFFN